MKYRITFYPPSASRTSIINPHISELEFVPTAEPITWLTNSITYYDWGLLFMVNDKTIRICGHWIVEEES